MQYGHDIVIFTLKTHVINIKNLPLKRRLLIVNVKEESQLVNIYLQFSCTHLLS